jgi:ubiquinone/menaquinone biosynthesis C-methylase UbiE
MAADRTDLHVEFAAPERGRVADRAEFLSAVDALPGLVEVRAAMRRAALLAPGSVLLDSGCGLGLEARRLAEAHPGATVIGLDRDPEILAAAGSGT